MKRPGWLTRSRSGRLPPLLARPMLVTTAILVPFALALAWYSFAPAPDYLLLTAILLALIVLAWLGLDLALSTEAQRWKPFVARPERIRGRDARVGRLRALLTEVDRIRTGSETGAADEIHAVIATIVQGRIAARGLDPAAHRADVRALLGRDLEDYLAAPPGQRHRRLSDLDHYLTRIERL
ncbi:MAG: hypothetical protein U0Q10_14815 [Dermatophilaceae bacterium]